MGESKEINILLLGVEPSEEAGTQQGGLLQG